MQKLNEFIGQIVAAVADARQIADSQSAALSEDYHANEFLLGMPIPHYTIDEAEITVPVMVVGIATKSADKEEIIMQLTGIVTKVIPQLYYRAIKNCYYAKQKRLKLELQEQSENGKVQDNSQIQEENATEAGKTKLSENPELKKSFIASAENVTQRGAEHLRNYLEESNLEMQKLIDISEMYISILYKLSKDEFAYYQADDSPFYQKSDIMEVCREIGKRIFFEFKSVFKTAEGIIIEPSTNKMNEYASENSLMHIKMKVREQDLDYVVEKDEKTGESKRFLSLK